MAKDLMVDENGDLVIDPFTHDLAIIDGLDEIAQRIRATLLIRYGEMPNLDPDQGADYSNFLGKNFNQNLASSDMSTTIVDKIPEVKSINSITFKELPNRRLYVEFSAVVSFDDNSSEELEGGLEIGD